MNINDDQKYIRLYKGGAYPARFYDVAWCKPGELDSALQKGWIADKNNLFGPDGKYPRKEPDEVKEGVVLT